MGPVVCGWQWPSVQDQLQRVADAGGVVKEPPPVVMDAGGRADTGGVSPRGGGCSAVGVRPRSNGIGWSVVALLAAWSRRRLRSGASDRRTPSTTRSEATTSRVSRIEPFEPIKE